MTDLRHELESYGIPADRLVMLDAASPDAIDYLDLVHSPHSRTELPDALIRSHMGLTLFVRSEDQLSTSPDSTFNQSDTTQRVLHLLACRGEPAIYAVLRPGKVIVYPVGFSTQLPPAQEFERKPEILRAFLTDFDAGINRIDVDSQSGSKGKVARQAYVHDLIFSVLTYVTEELLKNNWLNQHRDDVLSLVGRVLFARFLLDRNIMAAGTFKLLTAGVQGDDCFANAKNAAATCKWLDDVFNGELLPLWSGDYHANFMRLESQDRQLFDRLSDVMRRAPAGQQTFEHLWGDVHFGHIPIGVLSEVYEHYAHQFFGEDARRESIHYTPRAIAEFMISQAFPAITTCRPYEARILDPAVGAGVFLVLGLRRLVAEHWRHTGQRPGRPVIRRIMMSQLSGLDVNTSALRLAALSLYLTALELDPDPVEINGLAFEPLIGSILRSVRQEHETFPYPLPILGSLGNKVPSEMNGAYDLTIGNPPWTAWVGSEAKTLNVEATALTSRVARTRLDKKTADALLEDYNNPDNVPDLPFVWRAMEWTKQGGTLCFALHGRLLFKRSAPGAKARNLLFKALRVTGVFNGAELTGTMVWPGINAPFCLLFAQNRISTYSDLFHFVSPYLDSAARTRGLVRVDMSNSVPIQPEFIREHPDALKTLFRGGPLDADVMRRIAEVKTVPLGKYWDRLELKHGIGLQVSSNNESARVLHNKPFLGAYRGENPLVPISSLPPFTRPFVHRVRDPGIYKGPIVLFPQGQHLARARRSLLALSDCVYNRSNIGYSAAGYKTPKQACGLAKYLFTLGQSDLFLYVALMQSGQFGVERDALLVEDTDAFPIVPYERLTESQQQEASDIADEVCKNPQNASIGARLNEFVAKLYRLESGDFEVIQDALAFRLPFPSQQRKGDIPPTIEALKTFYSRVQLVMGPFFELTGEPLRVQAVPISTKGWYFLKVSTGSRNAELPSEAAVLAKLSAFLADRAGATQAILSLGKGQAVIGQLAQARFWTQSRARMLALELIRSHGDIFPVPEKIQ